MARLSGKLTPKALGWDRIAIGAAVSSIGDNDRVLLGRIAGIVSGIRLTANDDTGEVQTGLKGQFRGISSKLEQVPAKSKDGSEKKDNKGNPVMEDGGPITVNSGVCYLPGGIQALIEGAYNEASKDDNKASVNFAIDLYGVRANNKAGYSFVAENLVEPVEADPLDMLLKSADGPALLAAPEGGEGGEGEKPE